jgi:hypothetical protein
MSYKDIESSFGKAFNRTILMLFKPFSLKKWIILAFIAFLAGVLSGGGFSFPTSFPSGSDFPPPSTPSHSSSSPTSSTIDSSGTQDEHVVPVLDEEQGRPSSNLGNSDDLDQMLASVVSQSKLDSSTSSSSSTSSTSSALVKSQAPTLSSMSPEDKTILFVLIGIVLVLWILLGLVLTWIFSRFSFIFLNSVANNTTAIKVPWGEYRKEGNSYFKLNLLLMVIMFCMIGFLGLAIYMSIDPSGSFEAFNWGLSLSCLFVVIVVWFFLFIFGHFIQQFVVPIMAKEGKTISPALGRFFGLVRNNKIAFLIYIPIAVILGIVCSIFVMLLALLFVLLLMLLALVVILIPVLLLGGGTASLVYGVIMGVFFVFLALLLGLMANLPVAIFYRAFTLAYLEKIDPELSFYSDDLETLIESSNQAGGESQQS